MAQNPKRMFDGPIAGANYTSDTRHYPWHRPPEFNTFDESVEYVMKKFSKPETMATMASSMANGASVLELTNFTVLTMIKEGSVTPDMGILVAGPIAKSLELIAEGQEIEYQRGWEQKPKLITPQIMKKQMDEEDKVEELDFEIQLMDSETEEDTGNSGLMQPKETDVATEEEQQTMLGEAQET